MVSREMREMTPFDFTQRFGEYPSREGLTILVVSFCCENVWLVMMGGGDG